MTDQQQTNEEPMTDAEWLIIMMLTKPHDLYPGPIAWLCRYAWLWYTSAADTELDVDTLIANHAPGYNRPNQATNRTNLIGCIDYIRRCAAKPPRWPLPGGPDAFDPSQWITPIQGSPPLNDLPVTTVELWSPSDDPAQNTAAVITSPAKWDGQPIPGRCEHREGDDQCDNQATTGHGHWDGGAPGQGNWHWHGRCNEHTDCRCRACVGHSWAREL